LRSFDRRADRRGRRLSTALLAAGQRWQGRAMFDFHGKVVLITGAAQGFGRVCALAFAECGAKLALCDLNVSGV
jgi:short chain dehydrogenase